ncbi:MAG: hypothetical protein ACK55Z_09295, partial [bacterium]
MRIVPRTAAAAARLLFAAFVVLLANVAIARLLRHHRHQDGAASAVVAAGRDDPAALDPVAGIGYERVGIVLAKLVRAGLRRQREDQGGGALAPCHGAAQALRLEIAQLLHKIRALHERHVRKVEVAEDLVLEAACPLLVGPGEVHAATVALQALLV